MWYVIQYWDDDWGNADDSKVTIGKLVAELPTYEQASVYAAKHHDRSYLLVDEERWQQIKERVHEPLQAI